MLFKKTILYSVPRSGSHATMNAMRQMGLKVPKNNQPLSLGLIVDHVKMSKDIFNEYDVFNIEGKQTLQLQQILEETDSNLICLRRTDIFCAIASFWGFMNGNCSDTNSRLEWTATGKKSIYDPDVIERVFDFNSFINSVVYCNHLVDNVFSKHKSFVTTINYESPEAGISKASEYFNTSMKLDFGPIPNLSDYFLNHEEFKSDIENRLSLTYDGGLLLNCIRNTT